MALRRKFCCYVLTDRCVLPLNYQRELFGQEWQRLYSPANAVQAAPHGDDGDDGRLPQGLRASDGLCTLGERCQSFCGKEKLVPNVNKIEKNSTPGAEK